MTALSRFAPWLLMAAMSAAPQGGSLNALDFLVGDWVGEGSGQPGEATGGTSLHWDLDHKILTRTNRADYPAANGRPEFSHTDLMIIYNETPGDQRHAIYFDNEGHVIHYGVTVSGDGNTVVLTSDDQQGAPRYRFTYKRAGENKLGFSFEIAERGKPWKNYTEGTIRRK